MFQAANIPPKAEQRPSSPSVEFVSHSSSDSAYFSSPTTSTDPLAPAKRLFGDALEDALDIVEQEAYKTDAIITIARKDLYELKNRQALTQNILNNLLCSSHGKPVVTCLAPQAP